MTENPAAVEPIEGSEQELPDIFQDDHIEEPVVGDGDTVAFATLYPTGGSPVHLPIADPANPPTIADAINAAGLTVGGSTQYWVDGSQVDPVTSRIADNMTISAVGNVKGG